MFTSLEVQQEPPVTEVEVSVISVLLHQLEQLRVQDLPSHRTAGAVSWSVSRSLILTL